MTRFIRYAAGTYVALIALTSGSWAQQVAAIKPTAVEPFPIYYPAVEFDRPHLGTLMMTIAKDAADLLTACGEDSKAALGCSMRFPKWCLIILAPDDVIKSYGWTSQAVIRHEMAHCNGWPADHRGWRLTDR